jgi:predicted permease
MNTLLSNTASDLRFAHRQMLRSPGFAMTAVLILALGIAANVIVFGVLDALVMRPLDVPHADRVMTLAHTNQTDPMFSYPEVRDVRDDSTAFSHVAAWTAASFGLEANGVTRLAWAYLVSGQYFEVAAVKPFLGRLLTRADDDHAGASDAAVLSWRAWKSGFNSDPGVIGKTIRLNKHAYTIVGVTPKGFYGTEKFMEPELFVPMANAASLGRDWVDTRQAQSVFSILTLKDGVTLAQAQADLDTVAARIRRQYPKDEEKLALKLTRSGLLGDYFGAPARNFLAAVMGLAGIVLLAACANLGGLFAARTADRAREISIRLAVGSSRWRIVRQVLMEALVVSALGGAFACVLAWSALKGLAQWNPSSEIPISFHISPQPSLVLAAFAIAVLAGLVFGLMPLRQIFKADPNDAIKNGNTASSGRKWALRDFLLAAQIALCCITVTAAFVALRGLSRSLTMDVGFNPKNAIVTKFDLNQAGYSSADAEHFQRSMLARVAQLPGVEAAAYTANTPLINTNSNAVYSQATTEFRPANKAFDAYDLEVSPGYFAAAGTPVLAGRDITFANDGKAPLVALVNREFARRLFHTDHAYNEQVVGRFFRNEAGRLVQIIGVVADGKSSSLSEDPQPQAFFPILQQASTQTALIVRMPQNSSAAAMGEMVATIRKTIHDLDPAVPIQISSDWTSQLGLSFFPARVATVALGLFGAFGLLLSITGTFGLASYTVSKRLRELSIRVALGAQAKQILSAALGRMLLLLATGSAVGILLGVATSHVLSAVVYQATAQEPFVLISVSCTILLTGLLSVVGPVRRALHVDPAHLLREQ